MVIEKTKCRNLKDKYGHLCEHRNVIGGIHWMDIKKHRNALIFNYVFELAQKIIKIFK